MEPDKRTEKKTRATWVWVAIGIVLVFGGFLTIGITDADLTARNAIAGGWLLVWVGVLLLLWTFVVDRAAFRGFAGTYGLTIAFLAALVAGLFLPERFVESLRPGSRVAPWMIRVLIVLVLQGAAAGFFVLRRKKGAGGSERAALAANVTFLLQLGVGFLLLLNVLSANHVTRWLGIHDATETGLYSLSDRTRGLLDGLADGPAPVNAVYLNFGTAQGVGARATDFLRQYDEYSPRFTLIEFDGIREKTKAEDRLRELGVAKPDLAFEDTVVFLYRPDPGAEPHRKDLPVRPATFMEQSALGTTRFTGEQLFTTAIQDVVLPRRKVYFLTGHEERPLYGTEADSLNDAAELARRMSLDVAKLELAGRRSMPKDADLLVIAGPRRPLAASERTAITEWLDEGGALILLVDPQTSLLASGIAKEGTGLEEYLAGMGIQVFTDHRCVDFDVLTGRGQQQFGLRPTFVITTAEYGGHDIVEDLSDGRYAAVFAEAVPVLGERPEGAMDVEVKELVFMRRFPPPEPRLKTFAQRLFPNRPAEPLVQASDMVNRRIPVAAAARRDRPDGPDGEKRSTRVVVFGDSEFVTRLGMDPQGPYFGSGNATLFANAVAWAARSEHLISIEPKTLELERTELSERQRRLAHYVSIYGIPGMILFLSILVAWRRRR
ncbi:MAG: Gldg family protein [Planctomycetota bacterium]